MNQEEIQQAARDETLVPTAERVKITSTNMRIDPTLTQKEETFQVVLDLIKASPCYNAFLVTTNVPKIYMQQFWFTVKKIKKTTSYEFDLADKKCKVDVELFRKILDICPRVPYEDFIVPPSKESLIVSLVFSKVMVIIIPDPFIGKHIYAASSENHPPMLNKDKYVPRSSRLLRYAKSKPNGKLIYNSIMHGPYVKRMIPELSDPNCEVPVAETFHEQTDDELTDKEVKQMEADDQAIQIILMGFSEDIYAAIDSCEIAQEIWFTSTDGELIGSYYHRFLKLMNDFKRNKHFPGKISSNLKFLNNLQPEWRRHVEVNELRAERLARAHDPLALMANSNNPYNYLVFHQDQPS
ncbi:hypothetical protein Tco_0974078 [Tanacetum coccineum]|uniref:Uncharacterized protein n=1 Tax=Tanacetum coccineum TaxID=301880 RepID=A0ABQ5EAL7_9ASTR